LLRGAFALQDAFSGARHVAGILFMFCLGRVLHACGFFAGNCNSGEFTYVIANGEQGSKQEGRSVGKGGRY
jgi:hypothetical protein